MTIPEAIEILEKQIRLTSPNLEPDLIKAIKLGIEALKKLKELRTVKVVIFDRPLPGETEK